MDVELAPEPERCCASSRRVHLKHSPGLPYQECATKLSGDTAECRHVGGRACELAGEKFPRWGGNSAPVDGPRARGCTARLGEALIGAGARAARDLHPSPAVASPPITFTEAFVAGETTSEHAIRKALLDEVLRHLANHPLATDTARGIGEWWLPRGLTGTAKEELGIVLDVASKSGILTEELGGGERRYRLSDEARKRVLSGGLVVGGD